MDKEWQKGLEIFPVLFVFEIDQDCPHVYFQYYSLHVRDTVPGQAVRVGIHLPLIRVQVTSVCHIFFLYCIRV